MAKTITLLNLKFECFENKSLSDCQKMASYQYRFLNLDALIVIMKHHDEEI